jgi:transcriptional regulator with PAS, ATPase and Fis domain
LFLDEITEMPLALQVKLLRVLETSNIARVGSEKSFPVDVRIIAATNRGLEEAVAEGKLREDLLYRLNVFPIPLPPLRERGDDVEQLAEHFLAELNVAAGTTRKLSAAGRQNLRASSWPGNLRELRNVMQRAFILAEGDGDVEALPEPSRPTAGAPAVSLPVGTPLATAERLLIEATLGHLKGDKKKVASTLEISLNTLYARLGEYKTH